MDATPLLEEPRRHRLVADAHEGQLEPRALLALCPDWAVRARSPLVLEPVPGRWIVVERFGAVVVWNPDAGLMAELESRLARLPGLGRRLEGVRDELEVESGAPADRVGFSEVALRTLSLDTLQIVSLALAQSVALEALELSVKATLDRFQAPFRALARHGRLALSHREALRLVGYTLEVRAAVLESLTLFDDPPETWESERLAYLDRALFDAFDLEERTSALQQKLAYLADASARVVDLLATRKSHRLEWIVIALIAFEILHALLKEGLLRLPGR